MRVLSVERRSGRNSFWLEFLSHISDWRRRIHISCWHWGNPNRRWINCNWCLVLWLRLITSGVYWLWLSKSLWWIWPLNLLISRLLNLDWYRSNLSSIFLVFRWLQSSTEQLSCCRFRTLLWSEFLKSSNRFLDRISWPVLSSVWIVVVYDVVLPMILGLLSSVLKLYCWLLIVILL